MNEYYYKVEFGLSDYKERMERRLNEGKLFAKRFIDRIQYLYNYNFKDKRVLIVGAGAEFIELSMLGANVYGIEPSGLAIEIIKLKSALNSINQPEISNGVAESIKFEKRVFRKRKITMEY